jgi:CBS domain-containing protein
MRHRTVAAVMTPVERVVTGRPGTPYKEIARLLTEHGVSALPIVGDADRVLGIVSEADLLHKESRAQLGEPALPPLTPAQARRRHKAQAATGVELMTSPAVTITPDDDVAEAARRLESHHIKRMPVVDSTGRLAGIISRRDILRVFLRTDAELCDEARTVLVDDLWIDPEGWSVDVEQGTVHLTGRMDRRSTVRIAEATVRRIDGIVAVHSTLTYDEDDTVLKPERDPSFHGVFSGHRSGRPS